ncbi:MAG: IS66 family transposase, partial [Myxococcales bacterium]|nr:IS66 family transposase [Myxococcales bacterium]
MTIVERVRELGDIDKMALCAQLYAEENRRMGRELKQLREQLAALQGRGPGEQLALQLVRETEQRAKLERKLFGESSERRRNALEREENKERAPQRGHGPTKQTQLPTREQVWELPKDECSCPRCGGAMEPLGEETEDSEEVTVVERRYEVVKHRRRKYRCRCNAAVVTTPGPLKLKKGGRYSLAFAILVIAAKYIEHMPYERQRRSMASAGLYVTTQTLWDVAETAATHLEPTYVALFQYTLGADLIGVDETWWRLMGGKSTKRWWVWAVTCENACCYALDPSRSAKTASALLEGFEGVVVCDGYRAYETLAKKRKGLRLAHCWSHVRRKFIESELAYPVESREALAMIGELFLIERAAPVPTGLEGDALERALEKRKALHEQRSTPLLDELKEWCKRQVALPRSTLAKAIRYMLDRWAGLTAFLKDSRIPIHNNH